MSVSQPTLKPHTSSCGLGHIEVVVLDNWPTRGCLVCRGHGVGPLGGSKNLLSCWITWLCLLNLFFYWFSVTDGVQVLSSLPPPSPILPLPSSLGASTQLGPHSQLPPPQWHINTGTRPSSLGPDDVRRMGTESRCVCISRSLAGTFFLLFL